MSHSYMGRHRAAFRRKGEATIFFIIHESAFGESAHHVGNGWRTQTEGCGNINHSGIALLVHQFLDALQVVFDGL